jgi:hypothetical protein
MSNFYILICVEEESLRPTAAFVPVSHPIEIRTGYETKDGAMKEHGYFGPTII